jgi:hypothetical protein
MGAQLRQVSSMLMFGDSKRGTQGLEERV